MLIFSLQSNKNHYHQPSLIYECLLLGGMIFGQRLSQVESGIRVNICSNLCWEICCLSIYFVFA